MSVGSLATLVGLVALAVGVVNLMLAYRLRRACDLRRTSPPSA